LTQTNFLCILAMIDIVDSSWHCSNCYFFRCDWSILWKL